jgi:hypothetical protein
MTLRISLIAVLILGFASLVTAQPLSDRIAHEAAFRLAFIDSPPVCPEEHSALQISGHTIWFFRSPRGQYAHTNWAVTQVTDNETYQTQISTYYNCLIDITIRAQVFHNGQWTPLLLPKGLRPGLSQEERRELEEEEEEQRPLRERLQESLQLAQKRLSGIAPTDEERQAAQAWLQGPGNFPRSQRIFSQTGTVATFLDFEGMPESCVGVGEYFTDQKGITFYFPTNSPDEFSQSTVDLYRFDDFRGRLVFSRRECQVEMTIGKAIRNQNRWLPIPIAAVVRSR